MELPSDDPKIIDLPGIGTAPDPQATRRPFKKGDTVRRVGEARKDGRLGELGIVTSVMGNGTVNVTYCTDNGLAVFTDAGLHLIELVEPAPEPKPEELLAAIRQATGIRAEDQPDLMAAVRSIASQMDRHRQERDEARLEASCERERAEAAERDARDCAFERDEAKAKLADLEALHRVMSMAKASTTEDWDFTTLMADVLARRG